MEDHHTNGQSEPEAGEWSGPWEVRSGVPDDDNDSHNHQSDSTIIIMPPSALHSQGLSRYEVESRSTPHAITHQGAAQSSRWPATITGHLPHRDESACAMDQSWDNHHNLMGSYGAKSPAEEGHVEAKLAADRMQQCDLETLQLGSHRPGVCEAHGQQERLGHDGTGMSHEDVYQFRDRLVDGHADAADAPSLRLGWIDEEADVHLNNSGDDGKTDGSRNPEDAQVQEGQSNGGKSDEQSGSKPDVNNGPVEEGMSSTSSSDEQKESKPKVSSGLVQEGDSSGDSSAEQKKTKPDVNPSPVKEEESSSGSNDRSEERGQWCPAGYRDGDITDDEDDDRMSLDDEREEEDPDADDEHNGLDEGGGPDMGGFPDDDDDDDDGEAGGFTESGADEY
ncbi:Uu.00g084900.m01.CDS01 [Anthostomella pinea]|uniref:Uu.00g084900.m01.CDS01 n=1 Tax=Anthostomella pinea TaxID=933095 RepID=A0AAI8YHC3_9PEZI|nr:Uu.00g084900.m01.CDS01 [Anthostomella pinea]